MLFFGWAVLKSFTRPSTVLIECPFCLYNTKEEDQDHFYFFEVTHHHNKKWWFELLRAFGKKHPNNRLLIKFNSEVLQGYNGVISDHAMSTSTNMEIEAQVEFLSCTVQLTGRNYEILNLYFPSSGYNDIKFVPFKEQVFIDSNYKDKISGKTYEYEICVECNQRVLMVSFFVEKESGWEDLVYPLHYVWHTDLEDQLLWCCQEWRVRLYSYYGCRSSLAQPV